MSGTQPDGSTGHPQRWIGRYYEALVFGFADIENACGGSGCYNGLARFKSGQHLLIVLSKDGTLWDDGSTSGDGN
jgi:hypothetical protein